MNKTKSFQITQNMVLQAYRLIKANKGTGGVDEVSIEMFDRDMKNNLYKYGIKWLQEHISRHQ